jgi:hypothetical protein
MRLVISIVSLLLATGMLMRSAQARNRLTVLSADEQRDNYYTTLRKVFHRLYDDDVVLSMICAPGSVEENAAGVLRTAHNYEAFSLWPSTSVWVSVRDSNTRPHRAPTNYPAIKVSMQRRPLSTHLAERIDRVCRERVGVALRAPELTDEERGFWSFDGLARYYTVRSKNRTWLTVLGRTRGERSDAADMNDLALALQWYAAGAFSAGDLEKALGRLLAKKT